MAAYLPPCSSSSSWVPSSTTRPWSSTTMRSADRAVWSRWAIRTVVRPRDTWCMAAATPGLGRQVKVGGRLVEEEHGRVDQLGAGQGDQLALAGRQRPAPLRQLVAVPAGQRRDELVGADGSRRPLHLGVGGVGAPVGDVVTHSARRKGTPPEARTPAAGGTTAGPRRASRNHRPARSLRRGRKSGPRAS